VPAVCPKVAVLGVLRGRPKRPGRVAALGGLREDRRVDVDSEDLHIPGTWVGQRLAHQDRQRIRLLARGTPSREDAKLLLVGFRANPLGKNSLGNRPEVVGVAEKERLIDRELLGERPKFVGAPGRRNQTLEIGLEARAAHQLHMLKGHLCEIVELSVLVLQPETARDDGPKLLEVGAVEDRRHPVAAAARVVQTSSGTMRAARSTTRSCASRVPIASMMPMAASRRIGGNSPSLAGSRVLTPATPSA